MAAAKPKMEVLAPVVISSMTEANNIKPQPQRNRPCHIPEKAKIDANAA